MKRPLFLFLTLLLIVLTFFLDHLARYFYLYWSQGWIDSVVHLLGGLGASLFSLWLSFFSGLFKLSEKNQKHAFIIAIFSSLIVGIFWEIYEYKIGFTFYSEAFIFDSLSDLFMDMAGGLLGYFIALFVLPDDVNLNY